MSMTTNNQIKNLRMNIIFGMIATVLLAIYSLQIIIFHFKLGVVPVSYDLWTGGVVASANVKDFVFLIVASITGITLSSYITIRAFAQLQQTWGE